MSSEMYALIIIQILEKVLYFGEFQFDLEYLYNKMSYTY